MITTRRLHIYKCNGGCTEKLIWNDIMFHLAITADFAQHMRISLSLAVEMFNTFGRLEKIEETK